ncbi:MAG: cobalt ECF transporter T component CbiQ [Xenococcaceae cyanobacterium]
MHLWLDNLSHNNRLRHLPPEHKLGFALLGLVIALIAHPPVQIAIALWMSVWVVGYARIPVKVYGQMLGLAIGFWVTSIPALIISGVAVSAQAAIQADALSGLTVGSYYFYLSDQGLIQASLIFWRTISTVSCLYFVLLTTPFTELLQVLRRLGCPVVLTELLLLMYRFIFILLSTARELWIAQQSRNGYCTCQRWIYSLSLLVSQLLQKTLAHYRQFVLSTAARGFNGEFRVWSSQNYHLNQRYAIEASLGCLALTVWNLQL